MAKLNLTFYGVEGTVDDKEASIASVDLSMSTGSKTIKEAKCYFKVDYTGNKVTEVGKETISNPISGNGPVLFAMNVQNIRFLKRMYHPNEITAEIQIAPIVVKQDNQTYFYKASVGKDALEKAFVNRKVGLTVDDDKVVCNDYYVYEIVPKYKKDAMYVSFRIYSPDHMLTLQEYCRSFVTKKLGSEILSGEIRNYAIPYATKDEEKKIAVDFSNMKHLLNDSKEHIFPYLVQYNESFYDFLRRTANRWGEFLFYENGKLQIGYLDDKGSDAYKPYVDTITYCDLTSHQPKQANAGSYHCESKDEELHTKLEKGKYDKVIGQMDSLLDYDNKSGDIYVMKKLASILGNDKTLYSFLVDTGVDDLIALAQAKKFSNDKNTKFNKEYFEKGKKDTVTFNDEQFNGDEFNEFSEFTSVVNTLKYALIIKKEKASGQNAIMIDFDTAYPNLHLGDTILVDKAKYLVVQVEGCQPEKIKIVKDEYIEKVIDTGKVTFKVTAIPQNQVKDKVEDATVTDSKFYPYIIPEGHVRRSGMQLGVVTDVDDPKRKNRVRVRFDWQAATERQSPWIVYASAAGSPKAGIHGKHFKGEPVVVDFVNGNIERPYVVGSVEQEMPAALKSTAIVHATPGGQSIKMADGTGAGMTAFLASFNAGTKMLQGFYPASTSLSFIGDKSKHLEGNIELADKYGTWSIKGSTNDRNISIKSAWGDVKINAFTGITISAPNGDVKIAGKNVTIEAGSNLTLKSGKNIKQKFLMEGENIEALSIGLAITKAFTKKIAALLFNITDLSLLRHILEIFFRPVEGKIELAAGRYLMLEAGGGKTSYPVQAYKSAKKDSPKDTQIAIDFEKVVPVVAALYDAHKALYEAAQQKKAALVALVNDCKKDNDPQCNSIDDIISALWNDPNHVDDAIGFIGIYRNVSPNDDIDFVIIQYFAPNFGINELVRMAFDPNLLNQRWRDAVQLQMAKKTQIKQAATLLGLAIYKLKTFSVAPTVSAMIPAGHDKLREVITDDNLPADCLFKTISGKDGFKNFASDYMAEAIAGEKKNVCRNYFLKLVGINGFERQASAGIGGILKATVPPVPQPDCPDEEWVTFVNSIQSMPPGKKPTNFEKWVKGSFVDPIKQSVGGGFDQITNFFHDDWAYGASKKGQILFSSDDGTMVLDRNIYRANVNNEEDAEVENGHRTNGLVRRVRSAMLQN